MSLEIIFYLETVYHLVKDNESYRLLPSQVAQQTLKVVDRTFKSFLGLLRMCKNGDYNKPVSMPRFLPKMIDPSVFPKDMMKIGDNSKITTRKADSGMEYYI